MSSNTDIHTNIRKQCQRQKISVRNIQNLYSMFMLSEGSNLGNGSITSINKAYNEVLLPWNKYICISNIRANPISIHYNIRPIWCHFFLWGCMHTFDCVWIRSNPNSTSDQILFFQSHERWFPPVFPTCFIFLLLSCVYIVWVSTSP